MGDTPTQTDSLDSTYEEISPTQPVTEVPTLEESEKKGKILSGIRDKVGIERDKAKRTLQKGLLVTAAVVAMLGASACGKSENPHDPWASSTSNQVMAAENLAGEKDLTESPEMEEIWNRAIQFWPDTKLSLVKEDFFKEAKKYSEMYPSYSPEILLSTFASVAMTESNGGNFLGPNQYSGARGWFQVVPEYHLGEFNQNHGTSYTQDQLIENNKVSIEVGTWALMRYAGQKNLPDSLRFFKGGGWFGNNPDDGIWWNRVSYSMNNLMGGRDILGMGYMDYNAYDGMGIRPANQFLVNPTHIGNVYIEGSNLNELVFDN